MRALFSALLILSGLALALSFAGRLHDVGDSLAVVRPALVLLVGVSALIILSAPPRRLGLMGVFCAALAAWTMLPPGPVSFVPDDARIYKAYSKNLLWRLPETQPVAEDILESGADFVMLQELHARNRPILDALRSAYPHQAFCPFAAVGGTAVLSRWPILQETCGEGSGLALAQAETPDGPLWLVSLHLHWPFPYQQPDQVKWLLPILEALEDPVLIGGDFNMVPWSYTLRSVARATDTKLSGYAGGTFELSYVYQDNDLATWMPLLPIDHILVPASGAAVSLERRPQLGSDHYGLLGEFVLMTR